MKQIVLVEPGRFQQTEVAAPKRSSHQALVQVHKIGVCGTDLNAFEGRQPFFEYPRVIGHELGVTVVDVPENEFGLKTGDRCAVEPYFACGKCRMCQTGRRNCCPDSTCLGVHLDGGMQETIAVPLDRLHRSDVLPLEHLALVETLGIGAQAVRRADLLAGQSVLIIGMGPIGLAVLEFAKLHDVSISICDRDEQRLAVSERFEVRVDRDASLGPYDVIFDATGSKASMESTFEKLAFGGTVVFVGIVQGSIEFPDPIFHRRELTIKATRNSAGVFPEIIQALEQEKIDLEPWLSHRLDFERVTGDFESLRKEKSLVKAVIDVK